MSIILMSLNLIGCNGACELVTLTFDGVGEISVSAVVTFSYLCTVEVIVCSIVSELFVEETFY